MQPIARNIAFVLALASWLFPSSVVNAQTTNPTTMPAQHPALFLVGDSILNPGSGPGGRGPVGWGAEITPLFDPAKIHVYNEGHGGRSSRSYIEEGWWPQVLSQMQAGDFVIMHFGNNDSANSKNYPDRISLKGNGEEIQEMISPVTGQKETIHTYGWYLRQYIKDAQAKGVTIIICSPPPRNKWVDGKIKRGMDGYAQWASDAAKMGGAFFIDLNSLAADRLDALGPEKGAGCFVDTQHTTKAGAQINAESVIGGLKQLKGISLTDAILPAVSDK